MENGDEGTVELRYVTYLMSYTSAWPGIEVQYTCSAAPVAIDRGAHRDSLEVEDENIAHKIGLTIEVVDRSDARTWNSPDSRPPGSRWGDLPDWPTHPFVDTLVVMLKTQAAYERAQAAKYEGVGVLDAVVQTTIDCIRDNASRSAIPIRNLKLVVEGPERYRRLSATMHITPRPNRGPLHSF